MFTLRLILYGLIALVPSDREEGMAAILVNTDGMVAADGCPMLPHRPVLVQVKGSGSDLNVGDDDVVLIPQGYYLDIKQDWSTPWRPRQGLRSGRDGRPVMLPTSSPQTEDFSWIAALDDVSPGTGGLRYECAFYPEYCPVWAMLRLWHGTARTCHLAHRRNDKGKDFPVEAFLFKGLGAPGSTREVVQAVADAVLVEIPFRGPTLEVTMRQFISGDEKVIAFEPENGLLTLIVANIAVNEEQKNAEAPEPRQHCEHSTADRHFEAYYRLSQGGQGIEDFRVPHMTALSAEAFYRMACEDEILLLAGSETLGKIASVVAEGIRSPPHSPEVCAVGGFSAFPLDSAFDEGASTEASGSRGGGAAPRRRPVPNE